MRKGLNFIIIFFVIALNLYSFDEGFVWALKANFNLFAVRDHIASPCPYQSSDPDPLGGQLEATQAV